MSERGVETDGLKITADELTAALRAGAQGILAREAACELLIAGAGGWWLRDEWFRGACVAYDPAGLSRDGGSGPTAQVRWDVIRASRGSRVVAKAKSPAREILLVAGSLAGELQIVLGEVLLGLDVGDVREVVVAMARRKGWELNNMMPGVDEGARDASHGDAGHELGPSGPGTDSGNGYYGGSAMWRRNPHQGQWSQAAARRGTVESKVPITENPKAFLAPREKLVKRRGRRAGH